MRGYDRDEVDEYDEYEDEGEEQYEEGEEEEGEEEEYEEEERKPTEEELEYLNLRQRLKERYRKNLKKENGAARGSSQDTKNRLPYDNYGSFFGPSQPIISQRVIQESKSLLENQHLASMLSNCRRKNEKTSASHNTGSKHGVNIRPPKVNELQRKVERIKVSRDYSFLSDDKEPPALKAAPPTRNVYVPNSEARSAQLSAKSKQTLGSSRNFHGDREERKLVSSKGQMHSPREERKSMSSNGQMYSAREERKLVSSNALMHSKAGRFKSTSVNRPNLTSVDRRKQHNSSNGIGPGRPAAPKPLPSRMPVAAMERKAPALGTKNHMPHVKIPPTSKLLPSVQKKHLEQKRSLEEHNRGKPTAKQMVASSKPQINKPLKQISSHATTHDQRPKKKPLRRFSDDEGGDDDAMAFSMLRSILGPRKYAARYDDDDDSDMEAGFDDIMREESRSAKIARKEDEEQLRLIEEEERQERMRKLAKKRKLSQHH